MNGPGRYAFVLAALSISIKSKLFVHYKIIIKSAVFLAEIFHSNKCFR